MHRPSHRSLAGAAGLAGACCVAVSLLAGPAGASPARRHLAPRPTIEVVAVPGYGHVLATSTGNTLYVLSAEATGKIVCSGGCLPVWPPLLVPASVKHLRVGPGVKGKIGFVHRSAGKNQVTFNGYPVYTYVGDAKPRQTNGEGIVHLGTWTLADPAATTTAATPVKPHPKPHAKASSGY